MLDHLSQHQINSISLWYVVQHSLPSFYKIQNYFKNLNDALQPQQITTWQNLGLHKNHIERFKQLQNIETQKHLQKIFYTIQQYCDFVLTDQDHLYPTQLLPYEDRPPILFGQGNIQALLQPQIAIVGSRKATQYGLQITYDFAHY